MRARGARTWAEKGFRPGRRPVSAGLEILFAFFPARKPSPRAYRSRNADMLLSQHVFIGRTTGQRSECQTPVGPADTLKGNSNRPPSAYQTLTHCLRTNQKADRQRAMP